MIEFYAQYEKLVLLVVGFVLTTILGSMLSFINNYIQYKIRIKEERNNQILNKISESISEIAEVISTRHYMSYKYIGCIEFKINDNIEDSEFRNIREDYYSSVIIWNVKWNLIRIKLRKYFSRDIRNMFYSFKNDDEASSELQLSITGKMI